MAVKKAVPKMVGVFDEPDVKTPFDGGDMQLVVAGNKVYGLKELEIDPKSIGKNIRDHYRKKFVDAKDKLVRDNVEDMYVDWGRQSQHIQDKLSRGQYTIPQRLVGKLTMVRDNHLCEARVSVFKPHAIVHGIEYLLEYMNERRPATVVGKKVLAELVELNKTHRGDVEITFKQNLVCMPFVAVYNEKTKLIYTPWFNGYHSMTAGKLCTGNSSGDVFWADPYYETNINVINGHSTSRNTMEIDGRGVHYIDMVIGASEGVARKREGLWSI